jgi:hypothetical protein
MRIGFLVGSVSREAGGLFQSVRGLAKAVASKNANVQVFGIRDEQSAVDLQEWRPLSVKTFVRDCARGATQTNSSPRCSTPISTFYPSTGCGNMVPSVRNAGIGGLVGPM